ncbi:hypothetical protein AMTRI_Chr04g251070 [Amborella trichopoda]
MALTKAQSFCKPQFLISFVIPLSLHSYVQQFSTKPSPLTSPSSLINDGTALPSSTSSFMVNLFVDSFGFSKQGAIAASSQLLHVKTPQKALSVLNFLKAKGFEAIHIHTIISKRPHLLAANVEKNLAPKFKLFEDLGLSKFDLGAVISANPTIVTYSLNKRLLPNILFLKNYLDPKGVLKILKGQGRSSVLVSKRLQPNVRFMESQGIGGSKLRLLLLKQTRLFEVKSIRLIEITEKVKELGIESHFKMYSDAVRFMSSMSKETWQRKFKFFKSFGWSEEDIRTAFQKSPVIFCLSEQKLQKTMDYFINELKYDEKYLCFHPHIFGYNLERRLIPRINLLKVLRSRKLLEKDANLSTICVLSEKAFLERYVLSFVEEAEILLNIHKGNKENSRN